MGGLSVVLGADGGLSATATMGLEDAVAPLTEPVLLSGLGEACGGAFAASDPTSLLAASATGTGDAGVHAAGTKGEGTRPALEDARADDGGDPVVVVAGTCVEDTLEGGTPKAGAVVA